MVDDVRERLRTAGQRLAEADSVRAAAMDDIAAAMKAGHGDLPIKEMAELAGVSRVTAHRLLLED